MKAELASMDPGRAHHVRRWLRLSLLLFILVGLAGISYPVEELNRRLNDFYFRLRAPQPVSQNVVLVLIDDASLAHHGRWPWPRHLLADLLRAVNAHHPRVVGLDILLSEPEDEQNDSDLSNAIRDAGNVVLAAKISASEESRLWVDPLPRLAEGAAGIGHVQTALDPDGVCRRVPVSEPTVEGPRLAFALEVARAARGLLAGEPMTRLPTRFSQTSGASETPGYEKMSAEFLSIDYRGQISSNRQTASPFLALSASDFLEGRGTELAGKAVLIGFGATDLSDRLATPVSDRLPMPGVEINANVLDQVLAGRDLHPFSRTVQMELFLGFCMLATWTVLYWPGKAGLLALGVLLASVYGAGLYCFTTFHRIVEFGPLLCAGVLAAPLGQLESLLLVDRALTAGLRELRGALQDSPQVQGGALRRAIRSGVTPLKGLHWKLELVQKLQTELISLYAFDSTLLGAMREGVAVFAGDGRLLYENPSWQGFRQRQAWPSQGTLDELTELLGDPQWRNLEQRTKRPGDLVEGEASLRGCLWHVRAVRLQATTQPDAAAMLLTVGDMTARRERDQARAEALSFVTHELRTPLVSIQGFAELLVRNPQSAHQNDASATIFRECRRLVAMINTYLDVLRLDAGHQPLRQEAVRTEEMVKQVRKIIQPLAEAAAITVNLEMEAALPPLEGDVNLIAGALLNLLSNAVKYSPQHSAVRLSVLADRGGVAFEVWNSGPAIPTQELSQLFEPFYRVATQSNSAPGWGLGLAFVKRIAEKHGGSVEATSDINSGICFRMLLPSPATPLCEVVT